MSKIAEQVKIVAQNKIYRTLDLISAYYRAPIADEHKIYTAFEADGKLYQFCRVPF